MSQQGAKPQQKAQAKHQRGGFVLGLIVGLLLGLAVALGVALYITKVPVPFINKVPQRTAEADAEEAARNKNWDPNAPLAGKAGAKISSGVVGAAAPASNGAAASAAAATAPVSSTPSLATPTPAPNNSAPTSPATATPAKPADKPEKAAEKAPEKTPEKSADKASDSKKTDLKTAAAAAADPFIYFVQAGAFVRAEDAEQQRAKLAMLGFTAKVMEREQSGRTVLRVRIGPMDKRDEAEDLQKKVEAAGIEANLVRVQR